MQSVTITYRRARNQGSRTLHLNGQDREERREVAKRAQAFLVSIGANTSTDYHTLSSSVVDKILAEAKRAKYRKPKYSNGSTGRYFFARLQRLANLIY